MGLSKCLIESISEEFCRVNNIKDSKLDKDGITFLQVGKTKLTKMYLGYKLDRNYSFYQGWQDSSFNYKEIFHMPMFIGD